MELNDIVQIQDTVADIEFIGCIGYISHVTDTTVGVNIYAPFVKGENAQVTEIELLKSQVYFVGKPNPNLLPL